MVIAPATNIQILGFLASGFVSMTNDATTVATPKHSRASDVTLAARRFHDISDEFGEM